MEYAKGLIQLGFKPNKDFVCRDDGNGAYIESWLSSETKPSDVEIAAAITAYNANEYQRTRALAYPSIQEQLDMQYWDSVNGTTTWADAIAKVKSDYPKGGE